MICNFLATTVYL